ncbi:hypothetical protein [Shewanella litorisediminis]|uniref:Inner membrane protein n=1 Tax=Shewanella litorisediminis TaxID=1173586 RepID=A0ABX7G5V0_9GAMM|nr:hypothetical protein [Shewanella litorisediminis]MCL2917520.1 hypothetical protein [Shewanella litorisediminis]QRH02649.1 hypothetical protein JQC75_04285 [Shewanella litorisediminis]
MLKQPLYESLPYLCMLCATATLLWQQSTLSLAAGLLLFFVGARVYILRSDYRRTDPARKRKKGGLPKGLYELLPFACLALSVLLLAEPGNAWLIFPALILLVYGLYILASRSSYRHHQLPTQGRF